MGAQRLQSLSTSAEFKKHLKHQIWPNDNIVEMGENNNRKVSEFLDSALKKMLERKQMIIDRV